MKSRSSFVCQQCGVESASWYGKCPSCSAWNSLVETVRIVGKGSGSMVGVSASRPKVISPTPLTSVKSISYQRLSTTMVEFDRVLGGGIVGGAVILVAGDPGVGKSTLLLSLVGKVGGWYVTGEESTEQVKLRSERLGIKNNNIFILPETNIESILYSIEKAPIKPKILIVDSIQTMVSEELEGIAGSVGQVRLVTLKLIQLGKQQNISIFIVGHVTKEGTIAGPKLLEHMVDVVCYFEGERYYQGRILRTLKNRFGPTDEVGIFEMEGEGLREVSNPSKLFLEGRVTKVPGSTVGVTLEGTRPLLIEVQSLVVSSQLALPRRVANGIDYNRLQVILAILQKWLNFPLGSFDIFVSV